MPTPNFNWTLPAIGQSSWHQAIVNLVHSVEVVINSMQSARGARAFTVVSAFPTNSFTLTYNASGHLNIGNSVWEVLSYAPYGALVGSFTVKSGFPVLLSLAHRFAWDAGTPVNAVYLRGIVNPGSRELFGSNSVWRASFSMDNDDRVPPLQTYAQFSAAAGTYGVTVLIKGVSGQAALSSTYRLVPGHSFLIVGRDVRP